MTMVPFQRLTAPTTMPLRHGWVPAEESTENTGIPPSRSVRIADLSAPKKRQLWTWIQAHAPQLAAELTGPDMRRLMDAFPGASPVLDITLVDEALQ